MVQAPDQSTSELLDGTRLRLARQFSGKTLTELGKQGAVSATYISKLERGLRQPDPETLAGLADVLGFHPDFFAPRAGGRAGIECNFRRRSTTTKTVQDREEARAWFLTELVDELVQDVELEPHRVPYHPARALADCELIAERLRRDIGIGVDAPIDNMVDLLEHLGVVVTRLEGTGLKVDAYSWMRGRGVVILSADKKSPTRSRFDAAHELGHLIAHRDQRTASYEMRELQADAFASALLMPRAAFVREFPRSLEWPELFAMKVRWGASLFAMIRRARDLSVIGAAAYLRLVKTMSGWGWKRGEPHETQAEEPHMIAAALELVDQRDLVRRLGWTGPVFRAVTGQELPEPPRGPGVIDINRVRQRSREVT